MTTQRAELFRILTKQHRDVDGMLTQLADAEEAELRGKLLPVLKQRLLAHAKAEEKTFYPALAKAGEPGETQHAKREHRDIEAALAQLEAIEPDDEGWSASLQRLTDAVRHHVEQEEGEVFDAAHEALDAETLDRLVEEFEERRHQELERLGGVDDGFEELTKMELLEEARDRGMPGRSSMTKDQLISHLRIGG
jgi:hemerythrin-like domain-containing protein